MNKKIGLVGNKFVMIKKIVALVVLLAMVFSLASCNKNNEIADYKNTAKATIETYANTKVEVNYTGANWAVLLKAVEDCKIAVDAADNKNAVDLAVKETKTLIDEVLPKEEIEMEYKDIESGFYYLQHAYSLGVLKQNDLKSIAYYRAKRVGNESIMDVSFSPIPKTPEVLDAETVEQIKKDYIDWLIAKGICLEAPEFGVQIDAYYGTYNDCVVVVMGYVNGMYADVASQEFIGGVKFYYGNSQRIYVWKK